MQTVEKTTLMWYNGIQDTTYNPIHFPLTRKRVIEMKKYTVLSLFALSCLSCNPLVVKDSNDNHSFKEMKIVVVNK